MRLIRVKLTTYTRLVLTGLLWVSVSQGMPISAQAPDPAASILNLHEGYLIVRLPTYSAKIDTLGAMIDRTTDINTKVRLRKLQLETIAKRDTLHRDYIRAFQNHYTFSKVAYIFDYDAHDLNTASYYNLEGEKLAIGDLSEQHLFYLFFERSEESKIDALVIYDRYLKKLQRPFPNTFSRGGLNFLFLKISEKNFAAWRVGKMEKALVKYYTAVKLMQE